MIIMITNITIVIDLFGYNQEQRAEASYSDIDRGTLKTELLTSHFVLLFDLM